MASESSSDAESQPLLANASPSAPLFGRRSTIAGILLTLTVLGTVLLINNTTAANDVGEGDDQAFVEVSNECLQYDDDSYFTPNVCGHYDIGPCYESGGGLDSCVNNPWCNTFCGTMCAEGEGAICFITHNNTPTVKKCPFQ